MVHIRPPCSHYWHLSICPTVAKVLASRRRSDRFQVSVAGRWRFASVSVADRMSARCFVRGVERWKLLDPILPVELVTGYGTVAGRLWTTVHTVPNSHSDFPLLGPLRNTWAASDLQNTPTWSKLSPRTCRQVIPIFFYAGIQALLPRGANPYMRMVIVRVWCVPSATHLPSMHRSQYEIRGIDVCYLIFVTCLYLIRNTLNFSSWCSFIN